MVRKRKVLLLVENAPVPGDPRVWNEAVTLRSAGYQVSIIAPLSSNQSQQLHTSIEGVEIYRFRVPQMRPGALAYLLEYSIALWYMYWLSLKVWRRHGFDVIHAANPPDMAFLIALFYRCFARKFIFDQHDLTPELCHVLFQGRIRWLTWLLRLFESCSYRLAHIVIVTNESFRQIALQRGGCRPTRVFVVRNGPRAEQVKASVAERPCCVPDAKRSILAYIGSMGKQDNVENALYALYYLVYIYGRKDLCLILMGDGSTLAMLQALARHLELDEHVLFTGWLAEQEMRDYLACADIGLVPDPQNGLNEYCTLLKVLDYMAAGLPLVAFDLVETRVSAQGAALYARSNAIDDFARQLERLLNCETLRRSMGELGRKRVQEQLGWEQSARSLLAAYEMLFAES